VDTNRSTRDGRLRSNFTQDNLYDLARIGTVSLVEHGGFVRFGEFYSLANNRRVSVAGPDG
jgi:hypothetical protein